MSTTHQNQDDAPDEGEDGDVSFEPDAIFDRLPDGLSDRHEGILAQTIRNPDAAAFKIADSLGIAHREIRTTIATLHKVKTTDVDADESQGEGTREATEKRGSARLATSFDELTEKQQAIVDYVARAPPDEAEDMTRSEIAAAVNSSPEYDVVMAESYPEEVLDKYEWLVHERRKTLRQNGELERAESDEIMVYDGSDLDVRATLDPLVGHLPDSNLDGLPERREQRPDATFESASDMTETEPETTTDDTDEPEIDDADDAETPTPVPASEVVQLPDEVHDPDRLDSGTAYWAQVRTLGDSGGVGVHLNCWGSEANSNAAIRGKVRPDDLLQKYTFDDVLAVRVHSRERDTIWFKEVPLDAHDAVPERTGDPVEDVLRRAQEASTREDMPEGAECLPESAGERDVLWDTTYWAEVNNVVDYGVFASLNQWGAGRSDVSGLIPNRDLLTAHDVGDRIAVELESINDRGIKLREVWPDVPGAAARDAEPEPEPEPEPADEDETVTPDTETDDSADEGVVTAPDAEPGDAGIDPDDYDATAAEAMDAWADQIEEDIAALDDRVDALNSALTDQGEGLRETIRSAVAGMNQSLAGFSERLDEIEAEQAAADNAPETRDDASETIYSAFSSNPAYERTAAEFEEDGDTVTLTFTFEPTTDDSEEEGQ